MTSPREMDTDQLLACIEEAVQSGVPHVGLSLEYACRYGTPGTDALRDYWAARRELVGV